MDKILITGANGQLGNEFRQLAPQHPEIEFIFTDVAELDICNARAVSDFLSLHKPSFLVNCAAYTAVDKAETDRDAAFRLNSDAVKNLNDGCLQHNVRLIHVSTDYVFDGKSYIPYNETDATRPASVYGESKLAGERRLSSFNSIIIRTSWLYSSFGNNFVKTMMRIGAERELVRVVFDQVGTPTYAADLADAILQIFLHSKANVFTPGIFHYSNEGVTSWYDFARQVMLLSGRTCRVEPIETKEYPTPTARPPYSVLNKEKIKQTFGIHIPHWQDSLEKCIALLKN